MKDHIERRAWRLSEIADAYGLSLNFVKKERRLGKLRVTRVGTAVIVLNEDLDNWLKRGSPEKQSE
jgi:hypothetical protein